MDCIRLLSIDDHWAFSKGLSCFRKDRDGVILSCTALNIPEALSIEEKLFDIILLDLIIPRTDPEDNFQQLTKNYPDKPIIILTSQENSTWERKMYILGAKAFLTKLADKKTLLSIIKQVHSGKDYAPEKIQEMNDELQNGIKAWNALFPVDKRILEEMYRDKNIKEIAATVQKSKFTVYSRLARIKRKLKIKFV